MIATVGEDRSRKEIEDLYQIELELEKRRCEKSYKAFVKSAWDVLEPDNPLVWNWHLDYLCDEVEQQVHRIGHKEPKEYDLVVNVPPRSLKSMIFTRMPAAYAWIHYPAMRFMRGSYAEDLALEHAVETRDIIRSDWYQHNWGTKFHLKSDQDNKSHFRTNFNGACFTTSTTGKACGRGANWVNLDDPLSPEQAESEKERAKALRFYKRTIKSRINNKKVDLISIVMQRLHEEDLTGYVLQYERERFKHICLPAEDCPWVSPPELRKFYVNGFLFPALFGKEFLDPIKIDPYVFAGQYQQRPSPEEGGMFKRKDWRFWKPAGLELPAVTVTVGLEVFTCPVIDLPTDFNDSICSWDLAFKDLKTSDSVAGEVWAARGPDNFLIDTRVGKMSYTKTIATIKELKRSYPRTTAIIIEDKANGPAVIDDIKKELSGVIAINPRGTKIARAQPMARKQAAGNIYLPHPAIAPWVEQFIEEFVGFPNAAHDDRVDAASQAIDFLGGLHRIWPEYKGLTKNFAVGFDNISTRSLLIISQYVEKDLSTSIVFALWNAKQGILWVIDEVLCTNSKPETVITSVLQSLIRVSGGKFTDLKAVKWIGNSQMFGDGMNNLASSYYKSKISIMQNMNYDEAGAITSVSRLLGMGNVILHARAKLINEQMSNWSIEGKEPAPGYGLCRSLCNMVHMLFESGTLVRRERPLREYSNAKTRRTDEVRRAHENGQLNNMITGGAKTGALPTPGGKDGWMT